MTQLKAQLKPEYDVLVLGGGNAALCAALMATEAGARVAVVETAPKDFRGGNSRHTRNCRCAHREPTDILTDAYLDDEFFADLMRVTASQTDEPLARAMHDSSGDFPPDVGEPGYLGLKLAPSVAIKPPYLADAPWAVECRTWQVINVKDDRQLVIGEGLHFHIRDELWDPKAMRVYMEKYHPIGRMFADRYCRTDDRLDFPAAPVVKAAAE